jgi:hypothetical protein
VTSDERFRELTGFGLMTAPSGAGAVVIHAEEGLDSHVVLGVVRLADKAHKVAIVTFRGCMQAVFGYPNDEAYWRDPRGADGDRPGYGFYEVVSSTWPGRLIAYNRHAFPDSTPPHYAALRHFFIGCHDASGEFLAEDLTIEITEGSYREALSQAVDRTVGWRPSSGGKSVTGGGSW